MTSLSTWFFGHPSVKRCTRRRAAAATCILLVPEVRELDGDAEVVAAQELHHGLQIVALLAGDAELVPLDRPLHLPLGVLPQLHDVAGLFGGDPLLQVHALLGGAGRPGLDRTRL